MRTSQFNSVYRGATQLVGFGTISGGDLISPTFDLSSDEQIEFSGSFTATASANIALFFNSDTTGTNYDCANVGGSASNNSIPITAVSGSQVRFKGTIFVDDSGRPTIEIRIWHKNTTSLTIVDSCVVWRTTGTNVTSFRFNQASGTLSSGKLVCNKQSSKGVTPTSYYGNSTSRLAIPNPQTTDPPFYDSTLQTWMRWTGTVWAPVLANMACANVDTAESSSSTSYVDLTTVGPYVTLQTGSSVFVEFGATCYMTSGASPSGSNLVSVAVSGATTLAANDTNAGLTSPASATGRFVIYRGVTLTGLTPGSNTFTLKYRQDSGNHTYERRSIKVTLLN